MLQIRLSKPTNEGATSKPLPADTVTVACPEHLILADLPVAKCLGSPSANAQVKIIGRRSRRQLSERVHFCVNCDLPIAIYGRLSPCEHIFCLDCARSDSLCHLCNDRIQKIQTIKRVEELFICAAPHCFKSFLKKSDFMSHIYENHADLLPSHMEIDVSDLEAVSARKLAGSDSTVQALPRPTFSLGSNSQLHDRDAQRQQSRDQGPPRSVMQPKGVPAFPGAVQNHLEQQPDYNAPPGFDRLQNRFVQQPFDSQSVMRQESGPPPDKQQGHTLDSTFPEYPLQSNQPPNFAVTINQNPGLAPPRLGYPPFGPDGPPPFYSAPYEMARSESVPEVGPEQGSLLGFPPGPAGGVNFAEGYPRPWSMPSAIGSFDPSAGQGTVEGFMSASDPQGRATIFRGDYGRSNGSLPPNVPLVSPTNKGLESAHSGSSMELREGGKGILAPQPMPLPPPPPFPPHVRPVKRCKYYPNETNNDGQSFG